MDDAEERTYELLKAYTELTDEDRYIVRCVAKKLAALEPETPLTAAA